MVDRTDSFFLLLLGFRLRSLAVDQIFENLIDFDDMLRIMNKRCIILLNQSLILFDIIFKRVDQLFKNFHLMEINPRLLDHQFFIIDLLGDFVE